MDDDGDDGTPMMVLSSKRNADASEMEAPPLKVNAQS